MNSMELIQGVVGAWLTPRDQTSLSLADIQGILREINLTQAQVWRAQPPHYRRQTIGLDFYSPAEGIVTVPGGYSTLALSGVAFPSISDVLTFDGEPLLYEGEPLIFNGVPVLENPRYYCSIMLNDGILNQFNGNKLFHPYLGQSTTSQDAILYHDAKLSPWNIERVAGPVIDRITRQQYLAVPSMVWISPDATHRLYSIRRVNHAGVERTLIQLPPQHKQVVSLALDAYVAPAGLTYGSSQRPVDLVYGTEVANLVIKAVGANLTAHPLFNRDQISPADADRAAAAAFAQLAGLSQTPNSQPVSYGTPRFF